MMVSDTMLRRALRFAGELLDVEDFDAIREVLLPGLAKVLGADVVIYHEVDPRRGEEVALGWPADAYRAEHLGAYADLWLEHPIVAWAMDQPALGEPVRISDWLSQRQWRDNPLFRESYRHLGIGDQIAVHTQTLDRQVSAAGVSLGRDGRTYSDGERDVLRLVTPHLAAALRRAAAAPVRTAALRVAPVLEVASVGGALPQLASAVDPRLTAREAEVLSLVATGLTDHQIARRLGVRPRTVSKHLEHVYSKLGVTNRLAALRAVSAGMKRFEPSWDRERLTFRPPRPVGRWCEHT